MATHTGGSVHQSSQQQLSMEARNRLLELGRKVEQDVQDDELKRVVGELVSILDKVPPDEVDLGWLRRIRDQMATSLSRVGEGAAGGVLGTLLLEQLTGLL